MKTLETILIYVSVIAGIPLVCASVYSIYINGKFLDKLIADPIPLNLKFNIGQKVATAITHEVSNSVVGMGVIIGWSHKEVSYWAFNDFPSDWYKVKMSNGEIVTYPQERLEDLQQSSDRWHKLIDNNLDRLGEPGYSLESYNRCCNLMQEQEKILSK